MFKKRVVSKKTAPAAAAKSASKAKGAKKTGISKGRSALALPKGSPLRKRPAGKRVDLGIGPVNVAPPKDAPRTTGLTAAEAAIEKKATDVVVLDVRGISGLCDEMVVCTARSVPHLSAVGDAVEAALRKAGERLVHTDGRHSAEPDWLLLDYGDVMVHIFRAEAREQYRLEDYYMSARLVAKWKNDD